MFKILVVEDDTVKLRDVVDVLRRVEGLSEVRIDDARDVASAKRLIRNNKYDLLLLDIMLPETIDRPPRPDGGVMLLKDMASRGRFYNMPNHIIGLTAHDEVFPVAGIEFDANLLTLLKYDAADSLWREALGRKVRILTLAAAHPNVVPEFRSDLCVITALQTPELNSILNLPWHWERAPLLNDDTIYHEGQYKSQSQNRRVIAAAAPRMGMSSASVVAMKMIHRFRPRYLAMTGIAAGVKGRCEIGDVIAADPSWDWGSGKLHRADGSPGFSPSPHQISLQSKIRGLLQGLAQDPLLTAKIRSGWSGDMPPTVLSVRIGPLASGAAVIANEEVLDEVVKAQHRSVLGVEMEAYGVFLAATEVSHPQPVVFALKSVCDFADSKKDDKWQKYAAYTSATTLKLFAEESL